MPCHRFHGHHRHLLHHHLRLLALHHLRFNYEIETCPEWEWWFVADPEPGLEKFKFTEYPREQKGSYERKPLKPSEFEAKRAKVNATYLRLERRELPHDSPPTSSLCR